jgi:hypothetical protein
MNVNSLYQVEDNFLSRDFISVLRLFRGMFFKGSFLAGR